MRNKRLSECRLRQFTASDLAGVDDRTTTALWLGHEDIQSTQVYIEATLDLMEVATPHHGKPERFELEDSMLAFLGNL